jgi:hypothetical protein
MQQRYSSIPLGLILKFSYRRGKELCDDVDIVYTHPQRGRERNLCRRLVERLRQQGEYRSSLLVALLMFLLGLVTHVFCMLPLFGDFITFIECSQISLPLIQGNWFINQLMDQRVCNGTD